MIESPRIIAREVTTRKILLSTLRGEGGRNDEIVLPVWALIFMTAIVMPTATTGAKLKIHPLTLMPGLLTMTLLKR